MLEDKVYWQSYKDVVEDPKAAYVFIGNTDNFTKQIFQQLNYQNTENLDDKCKTNGFEGVETATHATKDTTFTTSSNNDNGQTSSVPNPTNFAYFATPISRLPQRTKLSLKTYPTSNVNIWKNRSTYSVAATFFRIPFSTVYSTAFSTPHSTAHSTPHSTPFITPVRSISPLPETPSPTDNPLTTKEGYYFTYMNTDTSLLTLSNTTTNITSTITTVFTFISTAIRTYQDNTVKIVYDKSITTIATNLESKADYTLYYPSFTKTWAVTYAQAQYTTNTTVKYMSFVTNMNDVLSATFISTNNSIIQVDENYTGNNIWAYIRISTATVTYTLEDNTKLKLTMTNYAYILSNNNSFSAGYYTFTYGSSTTLTSSLKIGFNSSTFVPITIPTATLQEQKFDPKDPEKLRTDATKLTLVPQIAETTISGTSYFSGYIRASTNTITIVNYPIITTHFTFINNKYEMTQFTTLAETFSNVSEGQTFVTYLSIQTIYRTNTITFIYIDTTTITGTNVYALKETESSYFSINPTGTTYAIVSSNLSTSIEALPTNFTFNSPVFAWTSTFYLPPNGNNSSVIYTFTQIISTLTSVVTILHVPELSYDGVKIIENTKVITASKTTIKSLAYTISTFDESQIPSLTFSIPNFSIPSTLTTVPSLTYSSLHTVTQKITFHYSTSFSTKTITKIWMNISVYKSTFLEDGKYAYTETNTITKVITGLVGQVTISTVINTSFSGMTEFVTESGSTTLVLK
ncbi:hypothetical protein TVAG_061600 [Trichomonas vaginalis G3]|uniref:Uncharacterized protein n=1 Tax=Trichomonas vaginalis (strain ATCC PRA-98 / G3) TaxID=412133 RepID=A2E7S5_TRIV3|nr:hypothetical protein TVAGG3_0239690 [Trichomonas vaginalis G3]EAY11256.1 hypothetical protein TVAG_061600 [Trichomonas vaginalis G3]KAI5553229.1 hypothetical protein TVAGG3_0239690 [Trichomonas vaginalis G3]|eukprot:XP_001323479.1 hypothetical protein [Trichomonas vaginalis G3]